VIILNPHLRLDNGLVTVTVHLLLITKADRIGKVANLVKEIALCLAGDNPPKNTLYLMHNQLGHGIDTRRAVDITRLGSEVLARQFYLWVGALQLIEIVPVGCRRLIIQ